MGIRVLLADDHGVLRDGVRRLLEADTGIKVVAVVDTGRKAVEQAAQVSPDVVVMDITMPELNGIEATRAILARDSAIGVVILSMHYSAAVIRRAMLAGARGYVLKESAGDEVVTAVHAVAGGGRYMGIGVGHRLLAEFPSGLSGPGGVDRLTAREREVLQLVAEGKSNAEAAQILSLSPRTVETYRGRLMQKLQLGDLPSLVRYAIRHGIISVE
jgi:DNA-binding NarL/FixJ family response regulator